MKAIQVMVDEQMLARLDADHEVKRDGRSAVLRRAIAVYLKRKRSQEIREAYRSAYGDGDSLPAGFSGWEDEGTWPEP